MIVYAVIATDSVAARGLVNGWCLPRSGRRDILSVAITAFIFIGVIWRIIVLFYHVSASILLIRMPPDLRITQVQLIVHFRQDLVCYIPLVAMQKHSYFFCRAPFGAEGQYFFIISSRDIRLGITMSSEPCKVSLLACKVSCKVSTLACKVSSS